MKFNERREFLYDPEVFSRLDVQTALRIHDEYVRRHSGRPYPVFFEMDRRAEVVDPLWHQPLADRNPVSRQLAVPAIAQFEKLDWRLVRLGRVPAQRTKFWTSNLVLKELDYFPLAGDLIYWNGYRLEITSVDFEPTSFWQQTNVWLGIVYTALIVPDGDARPLVDPAQLAFAELSPSGTAVQSVTPGSERQLPARPSNLETAAWPGQVNLPAPLTNHG